MVLPAERRAVVCCPALGDYIEAWLPVDEIDKWIARMRENRHPLTNASVTETKTLGDYLNVSVSQKTRTAEVSWNEDGLALLAQACFSCLLYTSPSPRDRG
eukprot:5299013-Amphidinium_carterae.1